jgi:hypothetical protein
MSLQYLSELNPHERDSAISFKDEGHIYTINHPGYKSITGDSGFTSVTTFIHGFVEEFNADRIIDNMMRSKKWPQSKYYGMTREEIKNMWDGNRDEAASAGTKMHYDIECTYNNMTVENDSIEFKYFLQFKKDFDYLIPFRTEMLVYDEELRLAGSIDMIFVNNTVNDDGSKCLDIYDWKRSKEILKVSRFNKWMNDECISHLPDTNFWHYSLQLNVYKAILVKKYGYCVENLFLVILHPNNKRYMCLQVPDLQVEVGNLFKKRRESICNLLK